MQVQQDRTSDRKITAFARGKFKEKLPRSYQKDRWYGQMSSKQTGDRAYSKKGWLIFRNEGTKVFLKRLALCSLCSNSKDRQGRSEFSPWVKSCVEWENEKGKGVNSRTNKKANDEWHTCTQVQRLHGTTGLNKGFEKAGLKWIKSMGDPCEARVSQLVYIYNI